MIYSEGQNGELNLDFKAVVKNGGVGWLQIKNKINKENCKIEFLAVLGHWGWGPEVTEVLQRPFLTLGRITYSHLPNRFFI